MALIQLGTADGSAIGNPTGTDYWFFNDSNNPDPTGEAQFTRRDSSGVDIVFATGGSSFVESVTGDGVDNTDPVNPVLSFPDADEVDDSTTTNKFATQVQLDQIATNVTDIANLRCGGQLGRQWAQKQPRSGEAVFRFTQPSIYTTVKRRNQEQETLVVVGEQRFDKTPGAV